MSNNKKLEDFVSNWYKIVNEKIAYTYKLQPLNGEKLWPPTNCDVMLPPLVRRMPSRPKQATNKEDAERGAESKNMGFEIKVSRIGRTMINTNFGIVGHNRKTYKAPTQPNVSISITYCYVIFIMVANVLIIYFL